MKDRKMISNKEKIKLVLWMSERKNFLRGRSIKEVHEIWTSETKIPCSPAVIKRTAMDLDIKLTKGFTNSPVRVLFAKIKRLEAAYLDLCQQVGVTPKDMGEMDLTNDEEGDDNA